MARKYLLLLVTHLGALVLGFALGVYLLPIITAPAAPEAGALEAAMSSGEYSGGFSRDRQDSDAFHWGEGTFTIGADSVAFSGELSPGPDYQLYLSPEFVETEADFERLKPGMAHIGPIKTFDGFLLGLPAGVDPASYSAAIVWCETFGEFVTSGSYTRTNGSARIAPDR